MIYPANIAPTALLDHPIPPIESLKKNGNGISNHKSLDPNRNTLDKDKYFVFRFCVNAFFNVTFSFPTRPKSLLKPKNPNGNAMTMSAIMTIKLVA